jgi:3-hydroxybutyryl-CoA dehydrogenase
MKPIESISVIGAGQMGAGIAQVAAQAGYKTILFDSQPAALDKGMALVQSLLSKSVEKGKLSDKDRNDTLAQLKPAKTLSELSESDLVIEAIVEKAEIKGTVFAELNKILKPHAIIASNTSSISITRLANSSGRADRFIGMHFMNPVPVMKLIEIIRGLQTSDDTYQSVCTVSEKMGKTTVLALDGPGFIVNRILVPMVNEAIFLLQEGVKAEDIDTAMKLGTNQPMGPLALADFVGLDTLLYILKILHNELGEDKYRPCPLLIKYVEAGWYGKKSGKGFYQY